MKKRIISMLLLVVMLLGMLPTAAFAADSVEEALGEIDIYNGGVRMSYLSINGINRELIYTYYNYIDRNGQTREIPAYCVNPNIKGVPQTVSEGESIKYLAEERGSDPKVVGIVANGYPTRSLSELGVENKYHAYYATKAALWCYLLPNWDINNLKVNPSLTGVELQRAQQILAAAKDIYRRGTSWTKVLTPGIVTEVDQDVAYPVTVDGENYYQQIFTVTSETWVCDYIINVAFSDPSAVPPGTKIVDMNNREITQVKTEGTGNGYSGKFKVLYPADSIDGETGSVQLSIKTNVYKYGVYYAVCAEKDQYAAYLERYQKALERGYDVEGERYHWLYNELLCRVQRLREALLYMEALPHFLSGADEDHALQYIMGYTSRLFRPENIGSCERDENQEHPFFRDSNPYWRELQEAMDAFNDPEILSNRPLLYVYACELITRAHRLYLQIREVQFRSIDREKFHALMLMPQNTYMGSAS